MATITTSSGNILKDGELCTIASTDILQMASGSTSVTFNIDYEGTVKGNYIMNNSKKVNDALEKELQNVIGFTMSQVLMKFQNDSWSVAAVDHSIHDAQESKNHAMKHSPAGTKFQIFSFPNVNGKISIDDLENIKISPKDNISNEDITELTNIKELADQVVCCDDEFCMSYQLEKNTNWLLTFIEKYFKI